MEDYIREIALVGGAAGGQILHIVKKNTEAGASEVAVFKKWVLSRPFNTISASVAAVAAAYALQTDAQTVLQVFFTALMAGMATNSAINRAGK